MATMSAAQSPGLPKFFPKVNLPQGRTPRMLVEIPRHSPSMEIPNISQFLKKPWLVRFLSLDGKGRRAPVRNTHAKAQRPRRPETLPYGSQSTDPSPPSYPTGLHLTCPVKLLQISCEGKKYRAHPGCFILGVPFPMSSILNLSPLFSIAAKKTPIFSLSCIFSLILVGVEENCRSYD
ncbi:hypothetical protein BRADI_1g46876v3 [Brachypodium distachyon]|uniref:Uncharacterized protein n=1 Tax=Brachypodium distachyon TaxID=15368 RepID=A0A0Q3H844_BRADI|nr:hypothetical protein BRADI_1g46876v3 [Brachypodium distachyon]